MESNLDGSRDFNEGTVEIGWIREFIRSVFASNKEPRSGKKNIVPWSLVRAVEKREGVGKK